MSPLITMIVEAAEHVEMTGDDDAAGGSSSSGRGADGVSPLTTPPVAHRSAVNGAANWDVCTVSVHCCSVGCSGSEGNRDIVAAAAAASTTTKTTMTAWVEEETFLADEDICLDRS
jgi:hypothetical protein